MEPGRRGPPRDGFTDRWVGGPGEEPIPGARPPRMEKWGPEGDTACLGSLQCKRQTPSPQPMVSMLRALSASTSGGWLLP